MKFSLINFLQVAILFIFVNEVVSIDASVPETSHLMKRQKKDKKNQQQQQQPQQQLQQQTAGQGGNNGGGGSQAQGGGSPTEQAATSVVNVFMQMGQALEAVTNMGSDESAVTQAADAVIKMIPEVGKGTSALVATLPNKGEFDSAPGKATQAAEQLGKVLKTIQQTPGDANIIKKNYQALGEAYSGMFGAVDKIFTSVFPNTGNGKDGQPGDQQGGQQGGQQFGQQGGQQGSQQLNQQDPPSKSSQKQNKDIKNN